MKAGRRVTATTFLSLVDFLTPAHDGMFGDSPDLHHEMSRAYRIARGQTRRDAAEPAIVDVLEAMGCTVVRLDKPVDLLVGRAGRTHLVEVKTGTKGYGGKLNEAQAEFAQNWKGEPVHVLRTPEEAVMLVSKWRGE